MNGLGTRLPERGFDDSTVVAALDASALVAAIHGGGLSAERVVQVALDRAEQLSDLNAFITLNRHGALGAARHVDAMRAAGQKLGPLAGLPIVVKDNINTAELPTSAGTPALRDMRPDFNAPSLQRLLDAGAIVLGKTNMHELAFGITSTNLAPFAGPVRNPYAPRCIPGGSSGGTAAAIASRIAPCGLGTDTGGSIRVPAALCGIAGLRPSVGNGGSQRRYHDVRAVVPISTTRDTVGPMGRSVADVALLHAIITGTPTARASDIRGLRLGCPRDFWRDLDPRIATTTTRALRYLAEADVVLVDVDFDAIVELNEKISFPLALHEPRDALPAWLHANGREDLTLQALVAAIASPDVRQAFEAVCTDAMGALYPAAMSIHRPALQRCYAQCFEAHRLDAIIFPTTPLPAAPIDIVAGSSRLDLHNGRQGDTFATFIRHTDPASNAGLPGLSIPIGLTDDALPAALEIDGPLGSDERLLGIGRSIEQLFGPMPRPAQ